MPLSEILVAANVLPQHVDHLLNEGWTAEHFALCATSMDEFDNVMAELLEGPLTHLNKAALRLAWTKCQPGKSNASTEMPGSQGPQSAEGSQPSGSWSETFAPKLCIECQSVEGHLQEELPSRNSSSGEFPESSVTVYGGTSEAENGLQMDSMEV